MLTKGDKRRICHIHGTPINSNQECKFCVREDNLQEICSRRPGVAMWSHSLNKWCFGGKTFTDGKEADHAAFNEHLRWSSELVSAIKDETVWHAGEWFTYYGNLHRARSIGNDGTILGDDQKWYPACDCIKAKGPSNENF